MDLITVVILVMIGALIVLCISLKDMINKMRELRAIIAQQYKKNKDKSTNLNKRIEHLEHLFCNLKREYPTYKEVQKMLTTNKKNIDQK